jgi:hypothetical protein
MHDRPWWETDAAPPVVERPWTCLGCGGPPMNPSDRQFAKCVACSKREADTREAVRARRELHEQTQPAKPKKRGSK